MLSQSPDPTAIALGSTPSPQILPPCRRLVALLTSIGFGRIEQLTIRGGEPIFDDALRVIRTIKIAGTRQPALRPDGDPALRREPLDLIALIQRVGDGVLSRIEIAHGLPLFVEVVEPMPAE